MSVSSLPINVRRALSEATATLIPAAALGYVAAKPGGGSLRPAAFLALGLGLAAILTPEMLLTATLLAFETSSLTSQFVVGFGPAQIYPTDVLLLLLLFRALLRRPRHPAEGFLRGAPTILFSLAGLVLAVDGLRGYESGTPLDDVIRRDLAIVYFPILVVSLTRILRERDLSAERLWRYLAYAVLALVAWMLVMRALNQPFEKPDEPSLGNVMISSGQIVHRDFGTTAAFVAYPALAITGIAGMAHGGARTGRWLLLATIGIFATLTTLVRGEIFALGAAALVVLAMGARGWVTARLQTAVKLTLALLAVLVVVLAISPNLGSAIAERSLPGFVKQSQGADANKEYRIKAVEAGTRIARERPAGLGVVGVDRLIENDVDPGYISHSGVGTLLIYGGWPAFLAALLAVVALIRRSFQVPSSPRWAHPAFVGVLTMLSIYTISAAGLTGDAWVIGLAAIAIAARFSVAAAATAEHPHTDTGARGHPTAATELSSRG